MSIVCSDQGLPPSVLQDAGWACLKFLGPFDLSETGILLSVIAPLARARVAIFALATYDTDYVLVRQAELRAARRALRRAGHRVR